jgi:glyoxylase-like metal-dependent hydrolase (beta-lactamase superfamily II)/rhodanese-related sulfurtransferase
MEPQWEIFVTPGLGDNSYLLYSGDEAIVVDPQRDAWRFLEFARSKKLRIRYVLETHVHNDYVSGAREIQSAVQAEIVAPAKGEYKFPHLPVAQGDEVRIGDVRLVCMESPGHTFDHICWMVYDAGEQDPSVLFTGGSLLVGAAGRTDLLGVEFTDELTRKQYHTLQTIRSFPKATRVLPTHGAGSFCAKSSGRKERITTIGEEEKQNDLIVVSSAEEFLQKHLQNLPPYPAYYAYMAPINRNGPSVLQTLPQITPLAPESVESLRAWILDLRKREDFANAHIPGSINIEMSENFGTYAGWIVPFGSPVILITESANYSEELAEATTQLIRIGYEKIHGYLNGGMQAWIDSGRSVHSYAIGTIQDLCDDYEAGRLRLMDVRQKNEWDEGHAKNSVHAFVGDLQREMPALPREEWSIVCASGYRSAIGASILDARGVSVRLISQGGVAEFLSKCPDAKD